ncbi:hypothetical protein IMCC26134_03125 [Verrucomicrobia bacterium IMCC26134]|nr:hypothetical protein IMCC26134_03125 [Verrucomicrobia bacterium IMCC26134]
MRLLQSILANDSSWRDRSGDLIPAEAGLVLVFGLRVPLARPEALAALRARYPSAHLVLVSTAGNFADTEIEDAGLVCTALRFDRASSRCASVGFKPGDDLRKLCTLLAYRLAAPDLRHVLIFSDGGLVNGSVLSDTFNSVLPPDVTLSGGLAGDGTDFVSTLVGLDAPPEPGVIVAIGLYGDALRIGFGSAGGWTCFGPQRSVSAATGNILHTLDGRPALSLYKEYLGPAASGLPAAALRFPLHVTSPGQTNAVVRTILSIDEAAQSMTFAGDVPVGSTVRFMRATYEELISGAEDAARQAAQEASLVLCVSCVGRRIVLGPRTEDELEGVRATFGPGPVLTGFYSYGELAPSGQAQACQLHNQTMTITSIAEVDS